MTDGCFQIKIINLFFKTEHFYYILNNLSSHLFTWLWAHRIGRLLFAWDRVPHVVVAGGRVAEGSVQVGSAGAPSERSQVFRPKGSYKGLSARLLFHHFALVNRKGRKKRLWEDCVPPRRAAPSEGCRWNGRGRFCSSSSSSKSYT